MSDVDNEVTNKGDDSEEEHSLTLTEFLEQTHPSVSKSVRKFWRKKDPLTRSTRKILTFPEVRLHCQICGGLRTFRCVAPQSGN